MSTFPSILLTTLGLVGALLTGCATSGTNGGSGNTSPSVAPGPVIKPYGSPLPAGVTLRRNDDIQGVWLAPGFDFRGYNSLVVTETAFQAKERSNEVQMRAVARRVLRDQLVEHARQTGVFPAVQAGDGLSANAGQLTLSNTIIEYERGGGGARYFVGIYGGGQPVIRVRGEIRDAARLVCVYEMRRSGESVGSRMAGVFMSDEEIQRNDIRDLASDFADFIKRTAANK